MARCRHSRAAGQDVPEAITAERPGALLMITTLIVCAAFVLFSLWDSDQNNA